MEKKKLRKVQSGLFRIIFSRTGLVLVMILLQIGLFVVSMSRLQQYSQVINGFFRILGIIVLIYIINSEDNPAFKMTWMLCVMAFPAIGSLFYVYVKEQSWNQMGKRTTAESEVRRAPLYAAGQEGTAGTEGRRSRQGESCGVSFQSDAFSGI